MNSRGFTLLEILLSISLLSVLLIVALPVTQLLQNRTNLTDTAEIFVNSLYKAQTKAVAVDGDSSWGVKIKSQSVILYKGSSYAARDSLFDESVEISSNVIISGVSEFVFNRFDGTALITGTTTLSTLNNETQTVSVNSQGKIRF